MTASRINLSKSIVVSALSALLVIANVQIAQAATSTNVDKFFAAVKSTSTVAAIVKNTTSTIIIPMYASCTGDNYGEISVPFLVQ